MLLNQEKIEFDIHMSFEDTEATASHDQQQQLLPWMFPPCYYSTSAATYLLNTLTLTQQVLQPHTLATSQSQGQSQGQARQEDWQPASRDLASKTHLPIAMPRVLVLVLVQSTAESGETETSSSSHMV